MNHQQRNLKAKINITLDIRLRQFYVMIINSYGMKY